MNNGMFNQTIFIQCIFVIIFININFMDLLLYDNEQFISFLT